MDGEGHSETIRINVGGMKKGFKDSFRFFNQKKVQRILIIVLLLVILIGGSLIRVQNLPLLKDQTTEEFIPLALDPYYFLRISETIIGQGSLPEYDSLRQPFNIPYTNEILPWVVVYMYKIANIFGDYSIQYINVISPVIFFILGLIAFFFLIYSLTGSKTNALISSAFLAVIPTYLYRTMAGFSDHEAIGMVMFFTTLLLYSVSMKYLYREERKNIKKTLAFGVGLGILSTLTIVSWGGIANFIFMIIPASYLLLWLLEFKHPEEKKERMNNFLLFYLVWFFVTLFSGLFFGISFQGMLSRITLSSQSIIGGITLLLIISDFSIIRFKSKIPFIKRENLERYRVVYSLILALIIGIIIFTVMGKNIFSLIYDIGSRFIHPIGTERISLTVAENAQPFLNDWINQIGKIFFWLFLAGMTFVGFDISKRMGRNKHRFFFSFVWILLILSIVFSRTSPSSLFNGTNLISRVVFFGGLLLFFAYSIWIYFKKDIRIKPTYLIIATWLIFTLIAGRGAIRLFFAITPFAAFMGGYAITKPFFYLKNKRDDLLKMLLVALLIVLVLSAMFSFSRLYNITNNQAKFTGPSANIQWQQAMEWVRENVPEGSIFTHWWDYGYWVQYLGNKPTIADGGHFEGNFRDHLIGRYLLTTPNPETALSFMKTYNISYLLIDPTDLGKYSAYSRIGSDETAQDRFSQIPVMVVDSRQTTETSQGELRVYQGVSQVDEDIIYTTDNNDIFLPANNAFIIGVIVETSRIGESISIKQPTAVYFYNEQQVRLPLRYAYYRGEIIDFGTGIEGTVRIMQSLTNTGQGVGVDELGSVIYLSPKVSASLFAQLYLMDDPSNLYETITFAYAEPDPIVADLRRQGLSVDDIVFFQGFRGPIKIWKTEYPDNILVKEEFLRPTGEYAEFDDLQFTL
jgi:asparagine N-glycosylation enzyme membrane subunit Stt3